MDSSPCGASFKTLEEVQRQCAAGGVPRTHRHQGWRSIGGGVGMGAGAGGRVDVSTASLLNTPAAALGGGRWHVCHSPEPKAAGQEWPPLPQRRFRGGTGQVTRQVGRPDWEFPAAARPGWQHVRCDPGGGVGQVRPSLGCLREPGEWYVYHWPGRSSGRLARSHGRSTMVGGGFGSGKAPPEIEREGRFAVGPGRRVGMLVCPFGPAAPASRRPW